MNLVGEFMSVKPNKKKLLFRTIFMFVCMTCVMQTVIRSVDATSIIGMCILSFSGMFAGMGANYAWEFIWHKITGRVEV